MPSSSFVYRLPPLSVGVWVYHPARRQKKEVIRVDKGTFSVPEVARHLGISIGLAYGLVRRGELPSIRLGPKRLVVPKAALNSWLESQASKRTGV